MYTCEPGGAFTLGGREGGVEGAEGGFCRYAAGRSSFFRLFCVLLVRVGRGEGVWMWEGV